MDEAAVYEHFRMSGKMGREEGLQYLHINIRGALSGVIVIECYHSPCGYWRLSSAPPVAICKTKGRDQLITSTTHLG